MRDAGWVEGRNLTIDMHWGGGVGESLDQAIAGAVGGRPDVLVAGSGLVVRPVINAGVTTPVVFVYSGDPVVGGVVESYADPGQPHRRLAVLAPAHAQADRVHEGADAGHAAPRDRRLAEARRRAR
ncbi:MAG: hypothetical protein IPF73_09510 [Betaproteobacteria bacterium]|nr:hypothetical protein [Betaproteobacteria bacterium]